MIRPGFDGFNVLLRAYQLRRFQLFQFYARSVTIRVDLRDSFVMFKRFWLFEGRLITLVRHIGATRLAETTTIKERQRWQTVATNRKVKTGIEDLEALLRAFLQYELWLWKGDVDPDKGQVSPGYEEANLNLPNQSAG